MSNGAAQSVPWLIALSRSRHPSLMEARPSEYNSCYWFHDSPEVVCWCLAHRNHVEITGSLEKHHIAKLGHFSL